jgi:hypothetical protein
VSSLRKPTLDSPTTPIDILILSQRRHHLCRLLAYPQALHRRYPSSQQIQRSQPGRLQAFPLDCRQKQCIFEKSYITKCTSASAGVFSVPVVLVIHYLAGTCFHYSIIRILVFVLQHTLLLETLGISKATTISDPVSAMISKDDASLLKLLMSPEAEQCIVLGHYASGRVPLPVYGGLLLLA